MSDELTVQLRELAGTAETPPPGSGADVRATAGRRRRRRRTTAAAAGGCAAAALAAFLTLSVASSHRTEQRQSPAASAAPTATAATAATAAPEATVDLSRRILTVAGRELPISSGTSKTPTLTGLMTVTAKTTDQVITSEKSGLGDAYEMKLPWVLELSPVEASDTGDGSDGGDERGTGAERATVDPSESPTQGAARGVVYIAALTYDEEAPGNYDTTPGWIGLRTADARWLYEELWEGALVEIQGAPTTAEPTPTATTPTTDDGPVVPTALPESASPG